MRFVPFAPTAGGRGTRKTTNSMVYSRLLRTSGVSGGRWCDITRLTGHFIGTAFAVLFRLDVGLAQKGQHKITRKCDGGRITRLISLNMIMKPSDPSINNAERLIVPIMELELTGFTVRVRHLQSLAMRWPRSVVRLNPPRRLKRLWAPARLAAAN